jgi:glutamate/tyrosine decarboxylase-like PLP-dependent enzyme
MIRHLGRGGIAAMVERCCTLAERMARRLAAEPGVALAAPVELNQFVLRFGADEGDAAGDALTAAVIGALQADAVAFIGGADWRGRWVMRVSVSSAATTETDADLTVEAVLRAWKRVRGAARISAS